MFISYAQNFEDVILWRALKHIENGFYVDIGAQDPVVDSVSRGFYERGWRGVSAEPTATYAKKLREDRPDDKILQAAIGKGCENIHFFEIPETGLSTGDTEIAEEHRRRGFEVIETEVPLLPLSAIFDTTGDRDVHWLKIDVEGMEKSVIESWLPSEKRPWIVVIESTHPMSEAVVFDDWEPLLTDKGYEFVYFDGLNRFYVSNEHPELKEFFGAGPNVFDNFTVSGKASSSFVVRLQEHVRNVEQQIDDYTKRITEFEESMKILNSFVAALQEEKERLVQRNAVLKADTQVSSKALLQAQAQLNEHIQIANSIGAELSRVYSSLSWKLTAPLRLLNSWRVWVSSGTSAWLRLKPGSRPRRVMRRYLADVFRYVYTRPRLMRLAKQLVQYVPTLELRLRRLALASQGDGPVDSGITQVSELSLQPETVREVYRRLMQARKRSAKR